MRKITSLFAVLVTFLASAQLYAQTLTVTGRVVDESGQPLVAVTVFEDGKTSNGTMTDLDGNYSLNVSSAKATVVFSCLGFAEVKQVVGLRKSINVTLAEEKLSIDAAEVVSVG